MSNGYNAMSEKNFLEEAENSFFISELSGRRIVPVDYEIDLESLIELFKDNGYDQNAIWELFKMIEDGDYTLNCYLGDTPRSDWAELTIDDETYVL